MILDDFRLYIDSKDHADTIMLQMASSKFNVCNDNELATLFADCYRHLARYNRTAKEWFIYNGVCWEQDTGGCFVAELAKDFYKRLWRNMSDTEWRKAAVNGDEVNKHKAQQQAVSSLHKLSRRRTLLEDARSIYPFATEELDTDPWILNCPNCTLDLRTGDCSPHSSDDMLSHVCGAVYDPTADAPTFKRFVSEILSVFGNDGYTERKEMERFLQIAFGYALTGSVTEDCLFMLYGATTRNGKTTLMETILDVMGDYGVNSKPDTLAYTGKPNGNAASEDIARLKGKRLASISEPNKTMHLDAAKVKDMTGGGTQVARFLHENSFEFKPEFKIFMDTNYQPNISDETLFTSGRIHVINFERHFSEQEQDRDLSEKLLAEKSGILNWMLDGLRMFIAGGHLKPPEDVLKATKEYRDKSDKVGQFWDERMQESEENCKGGEVYKAYCEWCIDSNLHPQNKGLFFDDLRKRGYMRSCSVNGMVDKNGICGYKVKDDWKELTDEDAPPEWRG